jgi:hypothetical protein
VSNASDKLKGSNLITLFKWRKSGISLQKAVFFKAKTEDTVSRIQKICKIILYTTGELQTVSKPDYINYKDNDKQKSSFIFHVLCEPSCMTFVIAIIFISLMLNVLSFAACNFHIIK